MAAGIVSVRNVQKSVLLSLSNDSVSKVTLKLRRNFISLSERCCRIIICNTYLYQKEDGDANPQISTSSNRIITG